MKWTIEFNREEYENLIDGRNELTDMIKEFIKKGYALSGGSTEIELIFYCICMNYNNNKVNNDTMLKNNIKSIFI